MGCLAIFLNGLLPGLGTLAFRAPRLIDLGLIEVSNETASD